MKKEEKKSLKEINNKIQENFHMLPEEYQQQMQSAMEDLNGITADHEQMMKGLPKLLLLMLVMIILLAALFGSSSYYSVQLEDTIAEKNNIIMRYQYQDSVYSRLLDQTDTSKYISYRIYNGIPVTYNQLAHKYDSLQEKCYELQLKNANNNDILELLQRMYPYEVTKEKGKLMVSGPNYKEELKTANSKIDSLGLVCAKVFDDYEIVKLKYELIMKNYPIKVEQEGNRYYVVAPKVDSALLLLPHYRDKVTYDPEKNVWVTSYTVEQKETKKNIIKQKNN